MIQIKSPDVMEKKKNHNSFHVLALNAINILNILSFFIMFIFFYLANVLRICHLVLSVVS